MKDAIGALRKQFLKRYPSTGASTLHEEREKSKAARQIYDWRTAKKLTQTQLAERVGTTPSVISRLEDADYDGHTVKMLERIAKALKVDLRVEFTEHRK